MPCAANATITEASSVPPISAGQPARTSEPLPSGFAGILMPASMVRLSAGRSQMNEEAQLLCMLAGANSVFFGDKLLTTGNPGYEQDMRLFERAGLEPLQPSVDKPQPHGKQPQS